MMTQTTSADKSVSGGSACSNDARSAVALGGWATAFAAPPLYEAEPPKNWPALATTARRHSRW